MTLSDLLVDEFNLEMAKTRTMLEAVPFEEPDWKPHEKSMTIARLASHLSELPEWATHIIHLKSFKVDPTYKAYVANSSQDMLKHFDRTVEEARAALSHTTDEQLLQNWTLSSADKVVQSKSRYQALLESVLHHAIHHRGQLSVYLRLRDCRVPGVYGESADEK